MKKSLVALAVLAASGASFAQSSVTLYGLADVWVGSVKSDNGAGTKTTTTMLESGGVNTSRWGMKGSEDLGGGMKANFQLESKVVFDTGVSTGFDRQAWVGVSGGFGDVSLGKVWTAYDDVNGASNAIFDSVGLAPANYVFKSVGYEDNPANGIRYALPTMGGFSAVVSYSLDEKATGAAAQAAAVAAGATDSGVAAGLAASGLAATAISVAYANGPLGLQFGYQDESLNNGKTVTATYADQSFMRLGASYDLGVAVAKATYGQVKNVGYTDGLDATEYQIGVDVPLSSALTLSASYAASENDSAAPNDEERNGYGIAAAYTLSKRTFVYGGYTRITAENTRLNGVLVTGDATTDVFVVGVQHKF